MWGIVPAAGQGTRIQPLAFSKELLPVGSSSRLDGRERPRAVGEYLIERMRIAGADKICIVVSPGKSDIVEYFGGEIEDTRICYAVQPQPLGLCDAIFRALPFMSPDEIVLVGLPDTIWFPEDGLKRLEPHRGLGFLCFPVTSPEHFDAVVSNEQGRVEEIQVKSREARSNWIWGAFSARAHVFFELHELWVERGRIDPYIGTLVNAWLARGGEATAVRAGLSYIDVGTVHGYRDAIRMLGSGEGSQVQPCEHR